jgi:hypothetical protein
MPKAVVDSAAERKDLKSLLGGFVTLKRMSFGAWLHRQDIAMQMTMDMDVKSQKADAGVQMSNEAVTVYEFAQCIVDHNLTEDEEETQKLNFGIGGDGVTKLDPKVGNEVSEYIREMHEVDLGN